MRLTENFKLKELVHPDLLSSIGDRAADFLHPMLPIVLQSLRDEFGLIIVNGRYHGIDFIDSGLRMPDGDVGARLSAHRFGCAADLKFLDADPEQVQHYINQNNVVYPHITRMENAAITKTWLHVEVGQRYGDIVVFDP